MKKYLHIYSLVLFCLSCNNNTKQNYDRESSIQDSIRLVEQKDSIELTRVFNALGDTIFGDVLYGMSKSQAENKIRAFQEKLSYDRNLFTFADVKFMNIQIDDAENDPAFEHYGRYSRSFTWKGKLAQIVWSSLYISKNSKDDVCGQLYDFISYFEKKYGKCSSKTVSPDNWFYVDYEKHKNYFPGGRVAEWRTDKRLIQIFIKGKKHPEYGEEGEYQYSIEIRFFNNSINDEIVRYLEEKNEEKDSIYKEQRQKSLDAL